MTSTEFRRGAIDASGCIGEGWRLVTRNLGLYIGMCIVTMVLIGCVPIISSLLMGPMMGGFAYVVLRDMRDEPIDFGMLFKGFEKFLPLMILGVIQAIPGIIFQVLQWTVDLGRLMSGRMDTDTQFYQSSGVGSAALLVPFIIVMIGIFLAIMVWHAALLFAIPLIIEQDLGVGEAIKQSLAAVFGNLGGIIVLIILGGFVALLGILALCFGLLVAMPVVWAANVFAYRQVFPLIEQNFNMAPPPPTVYGDFGQGMN
jgi:uncharacterized membrane protein